MDVAIESNDEDKFILRRKDYESRDIVIHVALLLEKDQQETTKPFHAGLKFHVVSRIVHRMEERKQGGIDIKLSVKP